MAEFLLLLQDLEAAVEYFDTNFLTRPRFYISGGAYSLIKVRQTTNAAPVEDH